MRRPVIGITGPDVGGYAAWFFTSWAVRLAGGRPTRVTPKRGPPRRAIDGLVLGGGADVDPTRYRQPRLTQAMKHELERSRSRWRAILSIVLAPLIYLLRRLWSAPRGGIDHGRDALEWQLLERARAEGLPVLGICRGAQLMNVFMGGTLHQDLRSFYTESPNRWTVLPRKRVLLQPSTRLAQLLGCADCVVNSLHDQAVDLLGNGLRIAAEEKIGVVQAIEAKDRSFFIGVQWHPEYLPQRAEQRRLFACLVAAARDASAPDAAEQPAGDPAVPQERAQWVEQTESR